MTEKSFTPVSEVLKKETTTTETSKKSYDWSEAEGEGEDAWGNVAPEVVVSIGEIQEQQKEEVDKRSWPKNEGEEKRRDDRGTYKPPGSGYNNNNISNTRRERPPPSNIIPDAPPYQLKVNNLNYKVVENDLGEFFGELGVKSIRLLRDRETQRSRGSAIIEFNDRTGLENALKAGGTDFHGRQMDVSVFENRPRENNRFGPSTGSGPERKRYNFRQQDMPMESSNNDEGRERKKLNLQQRTLPLEERHINPGSINPGSEEKEPKQETKREETLSERRERERENPFGKASPIVTKYNEKPQPQQEDKPQQEKPKDDKFSRPFQKRNNGYNNDRVPKKNYDTNQDVPSVRGGNNSWNTRGGKKAQPRRGGSQQQSGQTRTSFNLKSKEEQSGGLETQNHYQVLFEGGDDEDEGKN